MQEELVISLAPEVLDEGSPEERAAFGLFTIQSQHCSLTEGFDFFLNGYRSGPLVSGYHAAEWFAWNWWRLRWESRSASTDWALVHRMSSIGEGYVWPNIAIFSDGVRTALISSSSARPDAKPFRYVGAPPLILPSPVFETAVDAFIPRIIGRLRDQTVSETNLDRIWRDVLAERSQPDIARYRKLEALLGRDPDEIEDNSIELLLSDAGRLGEQGLDEIAAESARGTDILTANQLEQIANAGGHDLEQRDAVRLRPEYQFARGAHLPAWRMGANAARALREQERLGSVPIENRMLADMAGTQPVIILDTINSSSPLSFILNEGMRKSRVVLRSRWESGRRFDLARLIGDRLISAGSAFYPATRAYTYRQKAQRSFAAEFLSPFEAVDEMLSGDYSMERQQDVAEYFNVSNMTINTLLKNHGRIGRDDSDFEFVA